VTPKPKAVADTATVTGSSGYEIDVDKYGRIKVLFQWDRLGKANNTSSAWLRVANPWAGPGYGAYFWPRVGNEVMISYIDGDPDQPVVTGSLFNGDNMPPYALPSAKTMFGIKTLSSMGGGGYNELRFNDQKGAEEIYMHAEKDWNADIGNNLTLNVSNNVSLGASLITLNCVQVTATGDLVVDGTCSGNGYGLTDLNASQLMGGTVPINVLAGFQWPLYAAVGGGYLNNATGTNATIGGGTLNQATNTFATVGGGNSNGAGGRGSTVAGGVFNSATNGWATVGGGANNGVGGQYATIPGGYLNVATGQFSFAAGEQAQATNNSAFVWGDGSVVTGSFTNSSVTMRAINGYRFYTSTSSGTYAYLAPGSGSWTSLSDRNAKEHFEAVDAQEVLARVSMLPLTTWNYKTQPPSVRHIGPTAQDFKAAFTVGESDRGISEVDEGGVALAAIQGLNQKVESENATLRAENAELKARLEKLEQIINRKMGSGR
jgi:phage baseplate assembly protein gpV